jgi:hypothetical protein
MFDRSQMLLETLLSPRIFARILLATGDYEDAPPCPFFGMSSPLVAGAFFAFVGAFMAFSEDKGLIWFSPWFDATFRPLTQAGVKGLWVFSFVLQPSFILLILFKELQGQVHSPNLPYHPCSSRPLGRVKTAQEEAAEYVSQYQYYITVEFLVWNKVGKPAKMPSNPIPYRGYSI